MKQKRTKVGKIGITRVGSGYLLLTLAVAVAATNTGNNALFMVLSIQLALLIISGVTSRLNLRGLEVELFPPGEIYANRKTIVRFSITNNHVTGKWFVMLMLGDKGTPLLITRIAPKNTIKGTLEYTFTKRGYTSLPVLKIATIFPFGFFYKERILIYEETLLVYPEIYPFASTLPTLYLNEGDIVSNEKGWGYETFALREFQAGDDPRFIHWKKTGQLGKPIIAEKNKEEEGSLLIILDNYHPYPSKIQQKFELLVSEAATAALAALARGLHVGLISRDTTIPSGHGYKQKKTLLQYLALVTVTPDATKPLPRFPKRNNALFFSAAPTQRRTA